MNQLLNIVQNTNGEKNEGLKDLLPQKKEEKKRTEPYTTSIVSQGRRKFHTTYPDGSEMVEEFDLKENKLVVRKRRRPTTLGGEGEWQFEIGGAQIPNENNAFLRESSSNPIFFRCDMSEYFMWRVRNSVYSKDNYMVNVEGKELVIRTKNKKYYKRWKIDDLERLGINVLDQRFLRWDLKHRTLIIAYRKPPQLIEMEKKKEQEVAELNQKKPARDGDVQCPTQ